MICTAYRQTAIGDRLNANADALIVGSVMTPIEAVPTGRLPF